MQLQQILSLINRQNKKGNYDEPHREFKRKSAMQNMSMCSSKKRPHDEQNCKDFKDTIFYLFSCINTCISQKMKKLFTKNVLRLFFQCQIFIIFRFKKICNFRKIFTHWEKMNVTVRQKLYNFIRMNYQKLKSTIISSILQYQIFAIFRLFNFETLNLRKIPSWWLNMKIIF